MGTLVYTSGSTGLAKGVMDTQANLVAGAWSVATYQRLTADDRVISALPWSVDYGLNQVLSAFWVGAAVVIERSSYGPDICRTLRSQRITGLAGVPALWEMLARRPSNFLSEPLPHLRYVTNSGEMLGRRMLDGIREAHPHVDVYLMYGLTEAFRSTYLEPDLVDSRPTSIGGPIPGTDALIVDEFGDEVPPGEVGEFVEGGATVALGYWRNAAATAAVYRPDPAARRRPRRPAGRLLRRPHAPRATKACLYYVGRRDQQVKIQGLKVSPTEVEMVLARSGLVAQSVAFTTQDDDGVALVAVVVPAEGESFDLEAVHAHCRRELPTYLQPARSSCSDAHAPDHVAEDGPGPRVKAETLRPGSTTRTGGGRWRRACATQGIN